MDTVSERIDAPPRPVVSWLPALAIAAVVGAVYYPITTRHLQGQGDFRGHIETAENLSRGIVEVPHLLFHAPVAAAIRLGATGRDAALVVTLALQIAAALTIFWFIRRYTTAGPILAGILATLTLMTGPILPPGAEQSLFMLGYFLPNAIHNPTVVAAKPFAPILLAVGATALGWTMRRGFPHGWAAPLVVLAGLAKPHYLSCITAAAAGLAGLRALSGREVRWRFLLLGLLVPATAVLAWAQIGTIWYSGGGAATFAPLAVLGRYVPVDAWSIAQRLASDIAFPLTVAALWPVAASRFPVLALAWAAYAVALGEAYLLAESGSRMFDGNFIWSGQMATYGLMVAAAAFVAQQTTADGSRWRCLAAWAVLLAHVVYWSRWVLERLGF